MLQLLLQYEGHEARIAHDGHAALKAVEEFKPEFVFLDIGMPRMDGYQAAQRFRAAFPGARMFAITGRAGEEARRKSIDAGFEDHLVKPLDVALVEKILA